MKESLLTTLSPRMKAECLASSCFLGKLQIKRKASFCKNFGHKYKVLMPESNQCFVPLLNSKEEEGLLALSHVILLTCHNFTEFSNIYYSF